MRLKAPPPASRQARRSDVVVGWDLLPPTRRTRGTRWTGPSPRTAHVPRVPVALGAALGVLLDARFGELPIEPHPVAAFGSTMQAYERRGYDGTRAGGIVHAAVGVGLGVGAGALLGRGVGATAAATFVAVAGRGLGDAAVRVGDALGRRRPRPGPRTPCSPWSGATRGPWTRPRSCGPSSSPWPRTPSTRWWRRHAGPRWPVRRARSATAPSTRSTPWSATAPPATPTTAGPAPGSTTWPTGCRRDSTAALVVAVRPAAAASVLRAVVRDAPDHPSPNSGVAEAAFAAALGLRLGGREPLRRPDRAAPNPRRRPATRTGRHRPGRGPVRRRRPGPGRPADRDRHRPRPPPLVPVVPMTPEISRTPRPTGRPTIRPCVDPRRLPTSIHATSGGQFR